MQTIKCFIKWVSKPVPKNLVLTAIPILLTISASWYFSTSQDQKPVWLLLLMIGLGVIEFFGIIHYTKVEININRAIKEYDKQNSAFRISDRILRGLFKIDAKSLTKIAHDIEKKGIVDIAQISITTCCNELCEAVYDVVSSFDPSSDLEVTYVVRIDKEHIRTIGYYNVTDTYPYVLNENRDINEPKAYYDAQQFRNNGEMGIQTLGENEITTLFVRTLGHDHQDIYKQYISVPILCDKKIMIGLLQVVARNDSRLATDYKQLKNIADTYLNTFAQLFLLKSKIERVVTATPSVPTCTV